MQFLQRERVVIVTAQTRLQKLKKKFNTVAQTKFYMKNMGGDFEELEEEDNVMNLSINQAQRKLRETTKSKIITREYLPNYIFSDKDVVVVIGQDGLVANTAKYATNIPIIGINPDPDRYDGVLLPFNTDNINEVVTKVLKGQYQAKNVTMAEAKLNDGQRLLAFNDLFIGPQTHRSARYNLTFGKKTEAQSSSGIIVSTGAGSTGWLSSLINMANGITNVFGDPKTHSRSISISKSKNRSSSFTMPQSQGVQQPQLAWDTDRLVFVVREPFLSRTSKISIGAGNIFKNETLELESMMSGGGVIFSDGIETDFLSFNSGTIAKIGIAEEKAHLVTGY